MFDIGFSEILLVAVVALVVLASPVVAQHVCPSYCTGGCATYVSCTNGACSTVTVCLTGQQGFRSTVMPTTPAKRPAQHSALAAIRQQAETMLRAIFAAR